MSADGSSIARVVEAFGKSLDLAEEASLHATEAAREAMDCFGFFRQAFADSGAPLVGSASQQVNEASALIREGIDALENAKQNIRTFVLEIAPSLVLSDSGKTRSTPSGEDLLNTAKRPRNLRKFADTAAQKGEDVVGLIDKSKEIGKGIVDLFGPPDPGGVSAVTNPGPAISSRPATDAAGSGDLVLPLVLMTVTAVKIAQVAAERAKRLIFGGRER